MPKQLFLNNFETVFIGPVKNVPSSGAPDAELDYGILRISDGAAGTLANPAGGDYYLLTAYKRNGTEESNVEVMRVTNVDNSVTGECRITVQRGQEGTAPQAYVNGDHLALRWTRGGAQNMVQRDEHDEDLDTKVDKVTGKQLSTEDFSTALKSKLEAVEPQATKNATDAQLRDRATHTGVQPVSSVDGLQGVLNNIAADTRWTDSREWVAPTVSQTEAEAGTDTSRKAWSVQRVWQAVAKAIPSITHSATTKTTPADADEFGYVDSAAGWGLVKLTWANLKAALSGLFVGKTGNHSMAGRLTNIVAFGDAGAAGIALRAPGTAQGQRTGAAFYPTFTGTVDNGPRRAADIWASYSGTWGGERLSLGVGRGASENDVEMATIERLALLGDGSVLVLTGPIGYGAGAGGTVTQTTSKSTTVTLNKPSGRITMHNAPLAAGASVTFLFSNSYISRPVVLAVSGSYEFVNPQNYRIEVGHVGGGDASIRVTNITGTTLSDALQINFAILALSAS